MAKHFQLKQWDLDNWKRTHPRVRELLTDPRQNFRLAEAVSSPDSLRQALTHGWKFFFEQVLQLNFDEPDAAWHLIELQAVNASDWGFLCNPKKFQALQGYEDWLARGYTLISYVSYHLYPGAEWAEANGLRPELFAQTHKKLSRPELVDLLEHIYLRLIVGLPDIASEHEVMAARRRYYLRAKERSFVTSSQLRRYGFRANMTPHGVDDIKRALHSRIAVQLGEAEGFGSTWNASEFRKRYAGRDLSKCRYCGLAPVALHHLLARADYPELMYHGDNVVPLCSQVHDAIHSSSHVPSVIRESLHAARDAWIRNEEARSYVFDSAIHALHEHIWSFRRSMDLESKQ